MRETHSNASLHSIPLDAEAGQTRPEIPDFLPWFAQRRSANGWTPERQRAFLTELALTGSVRQAAAAVGKSARSAWQLRDKPGAEHFAVVWDEMARHGREKVVGANFARAMHGEIQPVFRNGRYRGFRLRYAERIAIAVMEAGNLKGPGVDEERERLYRWEAALRRREMDLEDRPRTERLRAAEAHAVWQKEIAAERRREKAAEVRKLLRNAARPKRGPVCSCYVLFDPL